MRATFPDGVTWRPETWIGTIILPRDVNFLRAVLMATIGFALYFAIDFLGTGLSGNQLIFCLVVFFYSLGSIVLYGIIVKKAVGRYLFKFLTPIILVSIVAAISEGLFRPLAQ